MYEMNVLTIDRKLKKRCLVILLMIKKIKERVIVKKKKKKFYLKAYKQYNAWLTTFMKIVTTKQQL